MNKVEIENAIVALAGESIGEYDTRTALRGGWGWATPRGEWLRAMLRGARIAGAVVEWPRYPSGDDGRQLVCPHEYRGWWRTVPKHGPL